ncbi:MAG: amidohydrolase [Bacteroidales bacterium]|jgi:5-methylthioadenosine/S-adenosylhomocysteine deaminase|nr:amidohydrolase [Bacteroidales bacterium]
MSIFIKNVQYEQSSVDIFIEGDHISRVGERLVCDADRVLDGTGKAVVPGFVNGHTHAAMTLFRGFGDDMPLERWLHEKIWPREAKLTDKDVYWGVKLACLEMIKSGTTCFCDMYMHYPVILRAVEEMKMRALLGSVVFDHFNDDIAARYKQEAERNMALPHSSRVSFSFAPHAIYTVSADTLQWVNHMAEANNCLIQMHVAETQTECRNALDNFGATPIRYLHRIGLLTPRLVLAHCLWIDDDEIRMIADHGVQVIHNPASNLKLGSGHAFRYEEMKAAGIKVGFGTDSASSSNNLDMIEAAKLASLLQKGWRNDPTAMPAREALHCITAAGAGILRINAGKIAPGYLADLCLINLNAPAFTPGNDFVSNLIYAASHGSCVDTVICDGNILMENRKVAGEEEILAEVNALTREFITEQ